MNLVIHDLDPSEWKLVEHDYEGWTVISDNGLIRPCVGCFQCWNKTPGVCVIRINVDHLFALIVQNSIHAPRGKS